MKKQGDGGRRVSRVEQEIQKTVAQFLISGFRFPLPGLVTVARVLMPADLRAAKVYISVLGTDAEREKALETLNERAFEVQNFIGKELRMRYCPKLSFYPDDATEHVLKIDRILHELEEEKKKKENSPSEESE
ncbi:MAG: 30S ribosome-binding factor RbfA [Pseudobdellovibrionaceae bacterium]